MLLTTREIEKNYKIDRNSLILWENKGILNPCKTVGGHRRYLQQDIENVLGLKKNQNCIKPAIYARVSTKKQEENLTRQVTRLRNYCTNKGYDNVREFVEIASGINGKRKQLHKLIDAIIKHEVNYVVIEYKDRLARFGLEYIMHFFKGFGCTIEFLEEQDPKDYNGELVDDILSIITCFSARLYGKRGGKKHQ